jgi:hypothetical protein
MNTADSNATLDFILIIPLVCVEGKLSIHQYL